MNQSFQQFIYHKDTSTKNFPRGLNKTLLMSGEFLPKNRSISQLGISALPGTKLYLNEGNIPLIIGFTGFFEIDLSQGGTITKITVDQQSLEEIEQNDSAYLIIDIAYWGS